MEIKTYKDLEEHLLATMDSFTNQKCIGNTGLTKEWFWNNCMKICISNNGEREVDDVIKNNVLKEFPYHTRCDFVFEENQISEPDTF